MSRSGYSYDLEAAELNLWRGAVERAIKGRRGQEFLREMAEAMDAMPTKQLIKGTLINAATGEVCAIGAVCKTRGLDTSNIEEYDPGDVAQAMGIARALAAEIVYVNDEAADYYPAHGETSAERWQRVRAWINEQLLEV